MSVFAVRVSSGRARSRNPCRTELTPGGTATRSDGRFGTRPARMEHGKTSLDRRNAGPGAGAANPRGERDHAGTERRSLAVVGKDGRRSRQTSAPRGLRGPHCGFENTQRQAQWSRRCSLCRGLRIKPMNMMAKAFIFLVGFSAPAVWAAEPASVHEFSERCAASYASAFEVPVELVDAVIQVESGWNSYAVSRKGAAGLMQLMPATASRFGVPDRFNIEENIRGGVAY